MSLAHILNAYINMNLLVITGYLTLALYPILAGLIRKITGAASLLKLHYLVMAILSCLIFSYPLLPEKKIQNPSVRIWSAQTRNAYTDDYKSDYNAGTLDFSGGKETQSFDVDNARFAVAGFILSLLLIGVLKISNDLRILFIIRKSSYLIRRYRSVSIYANDSIKIPFSYWLPGNANIIIPTDLIGRRADYKITVYHELQHHRNGDTKWVYLVWLLKSLCILNPCIHLWSRLISELQEFACDEVLVDRKKIDSQDYARCLVEAAKSASYRRRAPVCATGLTLMVQRQLLKRRIEKMFIKLPNQLKWHVNYVVLILIIGLMTTISFASKGVVQDRRISMEQAVAMAEKAGEDTDFPVVVNDLVLKELNTYLGTSEGREFIKASLERMKNFRDDFEKKIKEYGVPMELLAIPLIESGYQEGNKSGAGSAGVWMFIPSTARAFGLRVDDDVDERLNVDTLTDAAIRYLLANKLRFNDWQLAVLAYNIGERNVQKTIEETGSRDVWDIAGAYHNNKNYNKYYEKFMAAVIIMKNPDCVADETESLVKKDEIQLIRPVKGWISSKYGYRNSPFTGEKEFHNGIDIAAPSGTLIAASASGIVKEANFSQVKGHYVLLQHKNNFQTFYAQCEKVLVKKGQHVKAGDNIASCGSSGRSTGPHLHFELRYAEKPVDPERFIESH